MAKINGTLNAVLSGSDKILHSTSATLTVNANLADTSTKDDGGWSTHLKGRRDWSIEVDGLYDTTGDGLTPDAILSAILNRTADTVIEFTTNSPTNSDGWTGNGTFIKVDITGASEEAITFSTTITGNGALSAIL